MTAYSIIIPVLNDAAALARLLDALQAAGAKGTRIVVDGGSTDASVAVAERGGCHIVRAERGRAIQLARGVAAAPPGWLWMLHADTGVSRAAVEALESVASGAPCWGRFDVKLGDSRAAFRVIGGMMNWRSRTTGICTGDQGIFVHASLLAEVGGIPQLPLMEDIELSKRLKRLMPPTCLRTTIATSARRWQSRGIVRTVLLMWRLRFAYWIGVSPARLARQYYSG